MNKKLINIKIPLLKTSSLKNKKCQEAPEACDHVKKVRKIYVLKEYRSRLFFKLLRFSNLFINIALIILNLLQIRYNIFPNETLVLYIVIVTLFASLTFLDAISTFFTTRNQQTFLRKKIKNLNQLLADKDCQDGASLIDKYLELEKNNNKQKS